MFRKAGIAVGVAALGALVPAGAALGHGSPQAYVNGFHNALWIGAALAAAAAVATAVLIRGPRADQADVPGGAAGHRAAASAGDGTVPLERYGAVVDSVNVTVVE